MKRLLLALAVLVVSAAPSFAQGLGLGVGFAVPVIGQDVITLAHNTPEGVVVGDRFLDASPQLVIDVHRSFKMKPTSKITIGPSFVFLPKVDFGLASNNETTQGVGAGFGGILGFSAGGKRSLNIGLAWVIQQPVPQLAPAWKPGFQAPRGRNDESQAPQYEDKSPQRLMLFFTISGLFG